jgi:hypothetical protein
MDTDALGIVRDMFAHIDATVPRATTQQADYARQLFDALGLDGGRVTAIEEPAYWKTRIDELGTWTGDPWTTPTYGLDASTTRPLEFNNGLIVDTAYAKLGVAGPDADKQIEETGTIDTVVYFDDSESTLHSKQFGDERVTGEVVQFPPTDRSATLSKSVAAAAQGLAESRQAARHVDALDGVVFLDGAVYPLGVLYWVLLAQVGRSTPAGTWNKPGEIVRNYIDVIDTQYEAGYPVVGVVKTSTISQLLDALDAKLDANGEQMVAGRPGRPDVPWTRDHQFIAEVLREDSLDHLTYTSWFVHEGVPIDGQAMELLEPFERTLSHGMPTDYRRAFFYVRLPKTGDVLRVETPRLMITDEDTRAQVQYKALKEIAQTRDVPRAVRRADRIARISRENRSTIRDFLTTADYAHDYNWDGRWTDIEQPPDTQTRH